MKKLLSLIMVVVTVSTVAFATTKAATADTARASGTIVVQEHPANNVELSKDGINFTGKTVSLDSLTLQEHFSVNLDIYARNNTLNVNPLSNSCYYDVKISNISDPNLASKLRIYMYGGYGINQYGIYPVKTEDGTDVSSHTLLNYSNTTVTHEFAVPYAPAVQKLTMNITPTEPISGTITFDVNLTDEGVCATSVF